MSVFTRFVGPEKGVVEVSDRRRGQVYKVYLTCTTPHLYGPNPLNFTHKLVTCPPGSGTTFTSEGNLNRQVCINIILLLNINIPQKVGMPEASKKSIIYTLTEDKPKDLVRCPGSQCLHGSTTCRSIHPSFGFYLLFLDVSFRNIVIPDLNISVCKVQYCKVRRYKMCQTNVLRQLKEDRKRNSVVIMLLHFLLFPHKPYKGPN